MSFRLVPKLVTLNDLEMRNGHYIARYFTEFGNICVPAASICAWPNLCTSPLYFVVRV